MSSTTPVAGYSCPAASLTHCTHCRELPAARSVFLVSRNSTFCCPAPALLTRTTRGSVTQSQEKEATTPQPKINSGKTARPEKKAPHGFWMIRIGCVVLLQHSRDCSEGRLNNPGLLASSANASGSVPRSLKLRGQHTEGTRLQFNFTLSL